MLLFWLVGSHAYAEGIFGTPQASFPPFEEDSFLTTPLGGQSINDGILTLADPAIAYATWIQRLEDTSLVAEATFADEFAEALFLGVRVQSGVPLSGYVFDLGRDGAVSLVALDATGDNILAIGTAGFAPGTAPVMMCCRLRQQTLSAWGLAEGQ